MMIGRRSLLVSVAALIPAGGASHRVSAREQLLGGASVGSVIFESVIAASKSVVSDVPAIRVLGYSSLGDGGEANYRRVNQEPRHQGFFQSQDGAYWELSEKVLVPQMFGTQGTAEVEATSALDRIAEFVNFYSKVSFEVHFPPGAYIYAGTGLSLNIRHVNFTATPGTVSLHIKNNLDFLTLNGLVASTGIRGINFFGGRHVVVYTYAGPNVSRFHCFDDLSFENYANSAISNNSVDQPYFRISRCLFKASKGSRAVGIALGGFIDSLQIEGCSFQRNAIAIKLGPRLSGSIQISNCDFLNFGDVERLADIWVVPNTSEGGWNAGGGLVISGCKFGNEGQVSSDRRILIAAEKILPNKLRADIFPDTNWISKGAFVSGMIVTGCRISSIKGCESPFITCSIKNFDRLLFTDNVCEGYYPSLCHFLLPDGVGEQELDGLRWIVRLLAPPWGHSFGQIVNNRKMVHLEDPWGALEV